MKGLVTLGARFAAWAPLVWVASLVSDGLATRQDVVALVVFSGLGAVALYFVDRLLRRQIVSWKVMDQRVVACLGSLAWAYTGHRGKPVESDLGKLSFTVRTTGLLPIAMIHIRGLREGGTVAVVLRSAIDSWIPPGAQVERSP